MADKELTDLTAATSVDGTEYLYIVNSSGTLDRKITVADFLAGLAAAEILTRIKTVDGSGSGLDADLLDGVEAASFVRDTGDETIAGVKTFSSDPVIPDEAYDATAWNGALEPPTKNAVRDAIEGLSGTYVGLTGDQTVAGIKTFSSDPIVPAEAYASGWNGSNEPPTKNDVYDKVEALSTAGTLAARPAAGASNAGHWYLATDEDGGTLYRSNGASWVQVAAPVGSSLIRVRKPSDTVRTATTTHTADPHLVLPDLEANTAYEIEGYLTYTSPAAGDMKGMFSGPSGSTGRISVLAAIGSVSTAAAQLLSRAWALDENITPMGCIDASTPMGAVVRGFVDIGATAGDLTFLWAQNSSDGGNTSMLTGSYLTARPM